MAIDVATKAISGNAVHPAGSMVTYMPGTNSATVKSERDAITKDTTNTLFARLTNRLTKISTYFPLLSARPQG